MLPRRTRPVPGMERQGRAPATRPRTVAEDKLWAALHATPGATTAELAAGAGIGMSTAGKILAAWRANASVTYTCPTVEGGRRAPGRWQITETDDDNAAETTELTEPGESTEPAAATGADPSGAVPAAEEPISDPDVSESTAPTVVRPSGLEPAGGVRLGKGALRGMVEDFLCEYPDEEFSPHTIAQRLGGKSAGAVFNAAERLVAAGWIMRTSDRPKRYRYHYRDVETVIPAGTATGGAVADRQPEVASARPVG